MKKSFVVLLAIILSPSLYAQEKEDAQFEKKKYGKFDFELGFEVPVAAAVHPGTTNAIIPFFHMEGRWQLEPQPIDVGFHLGMSFVNRRENGSSSHENYCTFPIMAVADWQFGRGKRFNPYVGLGAGMSFNTISNYYGGGFNYPDFAVSPRVGVRCFKFLNVSASYLWTQRYYSRLLCNLGFYF